MRTESMANDGMDFTSKLNVGKMDEVLDKLSNEFTEKERWAINKPAAQVYEKSLKYHLAHNLNPTRNGVMIGNREYVRNRHTKGENDTRAYKPRDRDDLIEAIDYNREHGGAVRVGFTRKSKKAYLGRFLNDGWDTRNQFGGPYTHVEGEHFFERSVDDSDAEIKNTELESLRKALKERGL